jgi:hypothetical protein
VIERATGSSPLEWVNTPGTYPTLGTLACFTTAGVIQGAVLTPFLSELSFLYLSFTFADFTQLHLNYSRMRPRQPSSCLGTLRRAAEAPRASQPWGRPRLSSASMASSGSGEVSTSTWHVMSLEGGYTLVYTRAVNKPSAPYMGTRCATHRGLYH